MTRLLTTEVALPPIEVSQAAVARRVERWLRDRDLDPGRALALLARSGVERRRIVLPLDEVFRARGPAERSAQYQAAAVELAERATRGVLARAGVEAAEVGLVTSVSCTGFMIPSLDAHLADRLPLRADVRRLPLTLLGCAGGAMGLAHTADLVDARPDTLALVVAVELASLHLQPDDLAMPHLVSSALFGDGAAATLVAGSGVPHERARAGPFVRASRTRTFPDTLDTMGFEVRDTGLHMILDARIPELLGEVIWPEVERFVRDQGLGLDDLEHFLVHPGGRAILDVVEERLGRGPEVLAVARRVLREQGNLSSVTVLHLLAEFERTVDARPGDRGLMLAFGPGFSAEMLLLEWEA